MKTQDKLLDWAIEIQSLAQAGLTYGKDKFDLVRYERLRDISAEMIAERADISIEKVKELFCNESGYQTPKVTTRSALFLDGRVLLVRENGDLWNLPGGWCDENQTVRANAEKELWEETGIRGRAIRLVAVQDRNTRNHPPALFNMANHLVLCEPVGEIGPFRPNLETKERGFFSLDALPPLDTKRTTEDQIRLCWEASQAETWETRFD